MNPSFLKHISLRRIGVGLLLPFVATCAFADVVTDWNITLENAMRNPTPSVPAQARAAAIVHVAIFDAVNGVARKYTPLRVTEYAPLNARADAAAVYAAYTTLVGLFPAKQALFDTQLAKSLAEISGLSPNSAAITAGQMWGEAVARQILAWRGSDGFSQVMTYTGSTAPGHWRHAPLGAAPAGALSMSATAPFALTNLASFDPGPPYGMEDRAAALATAAYAADLNEVKARGGAVSTVRTAAEVDLARLIHLCDPADINAFVRQSLPASSRLVDNARIFALLNIAASDGAVVCFQAKYKHGFWRPLQAIPYADLDGNPATVADPSWTPLGTTPSHPEYISGHSAISGAMLAMAGALLGDDTTFTASTSNSGGPSIQPVFSSFSAFSDAIVEGRINLGFHFRTACRLGQRMGYAVADQIVRSTMLPLPGSGMINLAVRGRAGAGDDTLIAGFNIAAGSRQALIRGVGPTLNSLRVAGALSDPRIIVFDAAGRVVGENDNWSAGTAAETAALTTASAKAGAFPLPPGSRDAAMIATLSPGSYTVHVSGVGGASGVTLVEVFEIQ